MEATYLGDIELTDEVLAHYGVKGMKWRHRKGTVNSAMANDPRYQTGYIVKPGDERARLNRLNPASSRSKPVTTATKKSSSSSTASSSSSTSSKKGKSGSKKAVKDLLSRFKLTKGGKSSSSTKTTKEKAAKGSSSSKKESTSSKKTSSTEKKESTSSKASTSSKTEEKKTTTTQQQPQVIEKTKVSEDYTKYLERQLGKANYSKLQNETVRERIKTTDAQKKRRARGVRKIYTRS